MDVNVRPEPVGDAGDGHLEFRVLERHGTPAAFADHVMVMGAVGVHELPSPLAVPEVQTMDEPGVLQRGECTVDARGPHRPPPIAHAPRELRHRAAPPSSREAVDHRAARAARAPPAHGELAVGQLGPGGAAPGHRPAARARVAIVASAAQRARSAIRKQATSASATAPPAATFAW